METEAKKSLCDIVESPKRRSNRSELKLQSWKARLSGNRRNTIPALEGPAEDQAKLSHIQHLCCVLTEVLVFRDGDWSLTKAERAWPQPFKAITQSWAATDRGHRARTRHQATLPSEPGPRQPAVHTQSLVTVRALPRGGTF